jgi:hypothetical protein
MAMGKNIMQLIFQVKADKAKKEIDEVGIGLNKVGKSGKIAKGGLGLMSKGLKGIGFAIKAAGIGLFVGLLSQLTGLFSQNQKTADTFQRIMIKLQPVFDAVGKVIETVAGALEALVDMFMGAVGWIGNLIGINNDWAKASNESADALVNQRKQVRLLEAELAMLQLQYQREAELMRQIRDDEALTIQERIDANFELGKILEEQLQHERSIAQESLYLAELELNRNKDNVDMQVALIEAKTKLAEIDERITGQRSEQLVNLNSLEREREAQQKEAAAKREEQLKKEAEMLQSLIDLQNEDIRVTKERFRTITEQVENAEVNNKAQVDELKRLMAAELKAHNLSVKNAKENIKNQEEQTQVYKTEIGEREKLEEDRKNKVLSNIDEEFQALIDNASIHSVAIARRDTKEKESLDFKKALNNAIKDNDITTLEGIDKVIKAFEEEANAMTSHLSNTSRYHTKLANSVNNTVDEQVNALIIMREKVVQELESETDLVNKTTQDQLEMSKQSAETSQNILLNSTAAKLAIEEKYAAKIKETEASLVDTTDTLKKQAEEELFLHFETTKEKEIRQTEEYYDRLLGLAENNAEDTEKLEQQKSDALEEIRNREGKEMIANMQERWKKMAEAKKKQDKLDADLEKKAQMDTLKMGIGLAEKGTAAYKALASTETIISTYAGATRAFKDVPSPWNFIQAGLIIATGMKNLAEINKTKVEGGGTETMTDTISDGGDMGGDVPALPTIGAVGFEAPPVQAYVVETDISNAQALQSELDLQSTL